MKKQTRKALLFFLAVGWLNLLKAQEEARLFDFWVGSWNVYLTGTDSLVATSEITLILDGQALREVYTARSGFAGESLSKYNVGEQRWEQFWADNSGQTLFLVGQGAEGKLVLEGMAIGQKGPYLNRVTWSKAPSGVRQVHEISTDGGKNWSVVFDGSYFER